MAEGDNEIKVMGKEELDALWAKIKNTFLVSTLKGAANGLAELDANGLVPSSQLPSYVDDVLEYASQSAFPSTGTSGKIYVALDTNLTYRWSGTAYVEISPSLALGETSSTAYRGDRGATAYAHATDASRLTTAQASGFYKFATTAEGHIASVTAVTASDLNGIYGFTIAGAESQTYNLATIASNASNGATAYGWGNHANAGYALAANLGTASTHAHGDYVTGISWDGTNNKLAWSKGGTAQTAITIGYATNADTVDGYHASAFGYNMGSSNYDCNEVGSHFAAYRFAGSPSNAFPNAAWSNMLVVGAGSDTMTQIGGPYNAEELYFRSGTWYSDGTGTINRKTWTRLVHQNNIQNFNAGSATTIQKLFTKSSEAETASGYYKIATITHSNWVYCSFTMLVNNSYFGSKFNTIFDVRCSDSSTTLNSFAFNIIGGTDISSKLAYLETKNGDNTTKIEIFMLCSRYEHPEFFLIAQHASSIMVLNTSNWGDTPDKDSSTTMTGNAANTIVASALTSTSIGSSTQPIYFGASGKPVACTYSLNKTVPSDALFTDANVKQEAISSSTFTNWRTIPFGASNSATETFDATTVTGQLYSVNTLKFQPSSGTLRTMVFKSVASQGTAPLVVASTTRVANLNADLLDGQHGSYYATASDVTTLQEYFTNGVANNAQKLYTKVSFSIGSSGKNKYRKFCTITLSSRYAGQHGIIEYHSTLLTSDKNASFGLLYFYAFQQDPLGNTSMVTFEQLGDTKKYQFYAVETASSENTIIDIYVKIDSYNTGIGLVKVSGTLTLSDGGEWLDELPEGTRTIEPSFTARVGRADRFTTARSINGTSFDGTTDITTANWGTARNISIADSDSTNTGTAVSVNGSAAVTLKLPATIKATLSGNASSATKATNDSDGNAINTTYLKKSGGAMTGCLNITGVSGYSEGIRIHNYCGISSIWFRCVQQSGYDAGMWGITANDNGLRFRGPASTSGTTPFDYVNILHGGNVGIGVPNPTQKLHVNGNICAEGGMSANGYADLSIGGGSGAGSVAAISVGGTAYTPDASALVTIPVSGTGNTLQWGAATKIADIGGLALNVTLPADPNKYATDSDANKSSFTLRLDKNVSYYTHYTHSISGQQTLILALPTSTVSGVRHYMLINNSSYVNLTVTLPNCYAASSSLVVPAQKLVELSYVKNGNGLIVITWSDVLQSN